MIYRNISNYNDFQCLAGRCPDTCCSGWEIDLDADILEKYASLPAPMCDVLSGYISQAEGYTCFRREGDRCPFLTDTNLCQLILKLGEDYLSVTCREHPRFVEEYGELRETCLSISCPEAARLLLESPPEIRTTQTPEPADPDPELDERLLHRLEGHRETLLAIARAKRPLRERFSLLLVAGEDLQADLEEQLFFPEDVISTQVTRGERSDRTALEEYYSTVAVPERPLDMTGFLTKLGEMEVTSERLPKALERVQPEFSENPAGENLLIYFLFRYVLRAVWDGDLTGKVRFAVYSTAGILALAEAMPLQAAASLYSRETEHSEENLTLLWDYLEQM